MTRARASLHRGGATLTEDRLYPAPHLADGQKGLDAMNNRKLHNVRPRQNTVKQRMKKVLTKS
jgi:hypothetical protein